MADGRQSWAWAAIGFLTLVSPGGRAATPSGVSEEWLAHVTREIRESEYHWSPAGPDAYTAPSRGQDLRARVTRRGLELRSRTGRSGDWTWSLYLARFGRDGRLARAPEVAPRAEGARVELRRESLGLVEWYENSEKGVEQGFTLARRPRGDGSLVLELVPGGRLQPRLAPNGSAIELHAAQGASALRYAGLHAFDATGAACPARLTLESGRIEIRVDDAGATYPLTVDPVVSGGGSFDFGLAGTEYGESVATAGDLNGDGRSDLVVGAPAGAGRVFVYFGGPSGPVTPAGLVITGTSTGGRFGASVSPGGDLNGDGYDDLLVGAPDWGAGGNGAAFVFFGGPALPAALSDTDAGWRAEGSGVVDAFGASVAYAGDVNGDGNADLVIGAPLTDQPLFSIADAGAVFAWFGPLTPGVDDTGDADWFAVGEQSLEQFGYQVATAGDVNGDGRDEIAAGDPFWNNGAVGDAGRALVFYGGVSGPAPNPGTPTSASWRATSSTAVDWLGRAVGTAGDVNGDGYGDLLIGAPGFTGPETDEGIVLVYFGGAGGLGPDGSLIGGLAVSNADQNWESNAASSFMGVSAATAGDLNGDGLADLVFGAPQNFSPTATNPGGYFQVHLSESAGTCASVPCATDFFTAAGSLFTTWGWSVATAGDVNGDGYSDVVIGGPNFGGAGTALFYAGGANGLDSVAGTSIGGGAASDFGFSVAWAGDVNWDGYADAIVGAPLYDAGEVDEGRALVYPGTASGLDSLAMFLAESNDAGAKLGSSVASAGDVNGDGYSDVIVGAPGYLGNGRAFVWHGGASGFPVFNGNPTNASGSIPSGVSGSEQGYSVASAGDVDGDGYADLVTGAPSFGAGGRVFVRRGSSSGVTTAGEWFANGPAGGRLGHSVAGAGDVNGDGFGDVVLGAPNADAGTTDDGQILVFLGSATGLGATGSVANADFVAQGSNASANLGQAVASAGDVNGDGLSDVLAGAPDYTNGFDLLGRAFLYQGSATVGTDHVLPLVWSPVGIDDGDHFGAALAGVGDVNGDGYGDVAVGMPDYVFTGGGRVDVWYGSATGLTPSVTYSDSDWFTVGTEPGAQLGRSVAGAWDGNGDGFSDLLIGAPRSGVTDTGLTQVFYGGGRRGLDKPLRQQNGVGGPIHVLGKALSNSVQFWLGARTPAGRGRVRLEWEWRPLGTAFAGVSTVGAPFDTGAPSVPEGSQSLHQTFVSGLLNATPYHWRARIRGKSPLFPHSPWLSIAGNTASETDVTTGGPPDGDQDGEPDATDNCPTVANGDQLDVDSDSVGDLCDSCVYVSNPRVNFALLTNCTNSGLCWATMTGGQRDDDHDGYGNKCDADFTPAGTNVGTLDLAQFNASSGQSRLDDDCGTSGARPCAVFDLDEGTALNIGTLDRARFNALQGFPAGGRFPVGSGKCPTCPLTCIAGASGSCL